MRDLGKDSQEMEDSCGGSGFPREGKNSQRKEGNEGFPRE